MPSGGDVPPSPWPSKGCRGRAGNVSTSSDPPSFLPLRLLAGRMRARDAGYDSVGDARLKLKASTAEGAESAGRASLGVTQLLQQWSAGDQEAATRVLPMVYDELRRIASRQLRRERSDHTLQATAIVNEAYLRLDGAEGFSWPSRAHFFAFASHLVRRILVDYARHQNRAK